MKNHENQIQKQKSDLIGNVVGISISIISILIAIAITHSIVRHHHHEPTYRDDFVGMQDAMGLTFYHHLEDGGEKNTYVFPASTGLTPSMACCDWPSGRCERVPSQWTHPTWKMLWFKPIGERFDRQYEVVSNGRSGPGARAWLRAHGDKECNGKKDVIEVEFYLDESGTLVRYPMRFLNADGQLTGEDSGPPHKYAPLPK